MYPIAQFIQTLIYIRPVIFCDPSHITVFQKIKDLHLFGIIIFLLLFDCVVMIPWSLTHPLKKEKVIRNTEVGLLIIQKISF